MLLDSGIRRAGDVAKALALGARAVLLGRCMMWSLAAGERGARRMLELQHARLEDQLRYLGCADVRDLDPSYVRVPVR